MLKNMLNFKHVFIEELYFANLYKERCIDE